ncbi:MAG: DUF5053 domain-containing protein [Bacteroides sp.]|nr:DUF5053 domain-containing protein [Bacteroides sp.]
MKLEKKLNEIKKYIGIDPEKFGEEITSLRKMFDSPDDIQIIDQFIRSGMEELTTDLIEFNKEVSVRSQLAEISKIVSFAYIAEHYFNKTRAWLHQRITGQIVNGKPAKFTQEEIEKLNFALQDISKKIGSTFITQ